MTAITLYLGLDVHKDSITMIGHIAIETFNGCLPQQAHLLKKLL